MIIKLENIGKKYNYHWIFRRISQQFQSPGHYAVLGGNGSGKSTLVKILAGYLQNTEGKIQWTLNDQDISDNVYKHVSFASPHLELIEELTLTECLQFHGRFKPFVKGYHVDSLLRISGLSKSAHKPIKQFSSGMKQRVKILLAVMSESQVIILDEPCSNLDATAVVWYQQIIRDFIDSRLLIVASNNIEDECFSCSRHINLAGYPGLIP